MYPIEDRGSRQKFKVNKKSYEKNYLKTCIYEKIFK